MHVGINHFIMSIPRDSTNGIHDKGHEIHSLKGEKHLELRLNLILLRKVPR